MVLFVDKTVTELYRNILQYNEGTPYTSSANPCNMVYITMCKRISSDFNFPQTSNQVCLTIQIITWHKTFKDDVITIKLALYDIMFTTEDDVTSSKSSTTL